MPVKDFAEFLIRAMPAPLVKLLLTNEVLKKERKKQP